MSRYTESSLLKQHTAEVQKLLKALTPKQRKFVLLYFKYGENGAKAYLEAYECKPSAASAAAARTLAIVSVAPVVKMMKEAAAQPDLDDAEEVILDRNAKLRLLSRIATGCAKEVSVIKKPGGRSKIDDGTDGETDPIDMLMLPADPDAAIRAIGEMNKMQGDLAAIQMKQKPDGAGGYIFDVNFSAPQ